MLNLVAAKAWDGAVHHLFSHGAGNAVQGSLPLFLSQKKQQATGIQRQISLRLCKALAQLFSLCSPRILQEMIRYVKMLGGPIK